MRNPCLQAGVLLILLGGASAAQDAAKAKPDLADVKYGPHERNVLDFWKAKSEQPAPLIVYIHGGGFKAATRNPSRRCASRSTSTPDLPWPLSTTG